MTYLALNEKILSRWSYHGLWGFRVDEPEAVTLFQEVESLCQDKKKCQQMINDVAFILLQRGSFSWFVRAAHWIFNINAYRTNYYNLQAYFSWQLYNEGLPLLTVKEHDEGAQNGGFEVIVTEENNHFVKSLIMNTQPVIGSNFEDHMISPDSWLSGLRIDQVSFESQTTHFAVNASMINLLKTLKIDAKIGQFIAIKRVGSAFKQQQALLVEQSHQREQVEQLQSDYNTLKKLISAVTDPYGYRAYSQVMENKLETAEYNRAKKEFEQHAAEIRRINKADLAINKANLAINEANLAINEANLAMHRASSALYAADSLLFFTYNVPADSTVLHIPVMEQHIANTEQHIANAEKHIVQAEQDFANAKQLAANLVPYCADVEKMTKKVNQIGVLISQALARSNHMKVKASLRLKRLQEMQHAVDDLSHPLNPEDNKPLVDSSVSSELGGSLRMFTSSRTTSNVYSFQEARIHKTCC